MPSSIANWLRIWPASNPSPLLRGTPNTWAGESMHTIGWVNFLSDRTQTLHLKMTDVEAASGVLPASGAAKSKAIRDLLKLHPFDPNWTLPSRLDDHPLVWTMKVNGLLMDIRCTPREAQVAAFEQGLMPYLPVDQRGQK